MLTRLFMKASPDPAGEAAPKRAGWQAGFDEAASGQMVGATGFEPATPTPPV
jgi:hypothetical protein